MFWVHGLSCLVSVSGCLWKTSKITKCTIKKFSDFSLTSDIFNISILKMVRELIKIFNESRLATFFSVYLTCIPDNEILCLGRMGLTLSGSFSNVNLFVYNLLH